MTDTEFTYDASGRARFHDTCVTDTQQPQFEEEWQRRAFGLAVALSEFGHYSWDDFQSELIREIGEWQNSGAATGPWEYYDHWVHALQRVINDHGLTKDGYVSPRDQDDH